MKKTICALVLALGLGMSGCKEEQKQSYTLENGDQVELIGNNDAVKKLNVIKNSKPRKIITYTGNDENLYKICIKEQLKGDEWKEECTRDYPIMEAGKVKYKEYLQKINYLIAEKFLKKLE